MNELEKEYRESTKKIRQALLERAKEKYLDSNKYFLLTEDSSVYVPFKFTDLNSFITKLQNSKLLLDECFSLTLKIVKPVDVVWLLGMNGFPGIKTKKVLTIEISGLPFPEHLACRYQLRQSSNNSLYSVRLTKYVEEINTSELTALCSSLEGFSKHLVGGNISVNSTKTGKSLYFNRQSLYFNRRENNQKSDDYLGKVYENFIDDMKHGICNYLQEENNL